MTSLHSSNPTNRRLSLSESREIARAVGAGEEVASVARRFGVARSTVYRAVEKTLAADGRRGPKAKGGQLTVRLDTAEIAALDVLAGRKNLSRSAVSRSVLRLAAGYLEPDEELIEAVRDVTRNLKAVGGHLNQIAAHLNREARALGKASVSAGQLSQVKAFEGEVKDLARQLDRMFTVAATRRRMRLDDLIRWAEP